MTAKTLVLLLAAVAALSACNTMAGFPACSPATGSSGFSAVDGATFMPGPLDNSLLTSEIVFS